MTDFPALDLKNIKGSIREFDRWMDEAKWTSDPSKMWPQALQDAGQRALLTLKSLDQPNAHKSPAFMAASRKDLAAFAAAMRSGSDDTDTLELTVDYRSRDPLCTALAQGARD